MPRSICLYPEIGEKFELAIPEPLTGVELNNRFGYGASPVDGWAFIKAGILQPQTKSFMIVSVGRQRNLEALQRSLSLEGKIPDGRWLAPFVRSFPRYDGRGLIGIADAWWWSRDGFNFPCICHGVAHFRSSSFPFALDPSFPATCRWIIEAP